jgi:two-component system sensor histidine kinase QseC
MRRMHNLLQPTLVRRVVLALLIAFGTVWLILMALEYRRATDPQAINDNLCAAGISLLASIEHIDDPAEARATIAVASNLINGNYRMQHLPSFVYLQLSDKSGKQLFLSPEAGNIGMIGDAKHLTEQTFNDVPYLIYRGENAHWTLTFAVPRFHGLLVLRELVGNLTFYMLVAFPCVLIPIWLAVTRGLWPLRKLSELIAARDMRDLQPLGFDPRYRELKPVVTAIDELLAQLRIKIAREHAFVQDAAHELRTPMAVISAQAHVLAKAQSQSEHDEAEQRMDQSIARASHLIQQLLSLARIDGERPCGDDACDEHDIAQLVRQELALVAPDAMARQIELELEAPDNLPHRLEQDAFLSILRNLLHNAIRYAHGGGQVMVELLKRGEQLVLSVSDDGPGIAEQERTLVFERFYRCTGTQLSGSGLGLAIVKQAAERMGGGVHLTTGLAGKGCRFEVTIPSARAYPAIMTSSI